MQDISLPPHCNSVVIYQSVWKHGSNHSFLSIEQGLRANPGQDLYFTGVDTPSVPAPINNLTP